MRFATLFVAATALVLPWFSVVAHADSVSPVIPGTTVPVTSSANGAYGYVSQVSHVATATGSQGELHVKLHNGSGNLKFPVTMCTNGSTAHYHAYLPANTAAEYTAAVQALLTSAMLSMRKVSVATVWNGSYCQITSVTLAN